MFELFNLTSIWASRLVDISRAGKGSFFEHQLQIGKERSFIYWSTSLPCPHPIGIGQPCTMGKMIWEKYPNIEASFLVLEQLNSQGMRPAQLQITSMPEGISIVSLGLLLKDHDEMGRLVIFPMWQDTEDFLKHEAEMSRAVMAYMFHIMALAMQVPYEQTPTLHG